MTSWFSNTTRHFQYYCNFSCKLPFISSHFHDFLGWKYDDERYCRDYPDYPGLTHTIISRLDIIEDQRAVLTDLTGTDYPVSFCQEFLYCSFNQFF